MILTNLKHMELKWVVWVFLKLVMFFLFFTVNIVWQLSDIFMNLVFCQEIIKSDFQLLSIPCLILVIQLEDVPVYNSSESFQTSKKDVFKDCNCSAIAGKQYPTKEFIYNSCSEVCCISSQKKFTKHFLEFFENFLVCFLGLSSE